MSHRPQEAYEHADYNSESTLDMQHHLGDSAAQQPQIGDSDGSPSEIGPAITCDLKVVNEGSESAVDALQPDATLKPPNRRALAMQTHNQPRGKKAISVMPEFKNFVSVACYELPTLTDKYKLVSTQPNIPYPAKLVFFDIGGVRYAVADAIPCPLCGAEPLEPGAAGCEGRACVFGCYRSPIEWHLEASPRPFPMDCVRSLKTWQAKAAHDLLVDAPDKIVSKRARLLEDLCRRKKELKSEDDRLKSLMPLHVRKIMQDKSIALFLDLVKKRGDDVAFLEHGLVNGFRLTGEIPNTGFFQLREGLKELQPRRPRCEVMQEAVWRIPLAMASASRPSRDDLDEAVLLGCKDEVAKDWLRGPFSKDQLDDLYGQGAWLSGKRFGIYQSSGDQQKLRIIDDFSIHGQNSASLPTEVLDHGGVDELVAILRILGSAFRSGSFDFVDESGQRWYGKVAKGWSGTTVSARTIDLKSAYKQLAVHPDDLPLAITAAYHPLFGECRFWQSLALPFGATSSVYAFNACSRALEKILVVYCGLICTSYFDDFPFLEPSCTTASSSCLAEALLQLLGWSFDNSGHKYKKFANTLPGTWCPNVYRE